MEAHLVLDRVTARQGGREVLDGLSFAVPRGQKLALLGPAGAGKTATLLLVAGFLRPTLGTVRLAGRDITMAAPHLRDIGMVFQDDALFPHLSVLDNVGFGLKMRGIPRRERRERARATLAALGMAALVDRHPARLDATERRLVALARAAAPHPALLLIDEPPAPADAPQREAVRDLLGAALGPEHITAILATHDRAAAFALADTIALLRDGVLQQIAAPRELYQRPASRFVASFTGGCNLLPARLIRRDGATALVALPGGTAGARAPDGLGTGPVLLCVRPHRVRLDPAGPVRGPVETVSYQGALTRVTLRLPEPFVAELSQAPHSLARGETVAMGWDEADAWLLPADS
jgi:ABC-type Fe3+/spermidine/putrescine transport system ATPase subunit